MKILRSLLQIGVLFFAGRLIAQPVTNGQNADVVLGQGNFSGGVSGTSATQLYHPKGVAVDPVTGKVFVADYFNSRVLRWSSVNAAVNGSAAEAVFGQNAFNTSSTGQTQSTMYDPLHLVVDGNGRLWVADFFNNRVLRFDNASSKPSGASADGVLGQPDFTTSSIGTTQAKMDGPSGVAVDKSGRLYVADSYNHRVLRFDNAAIKSNGMNADGVLGQKLFTSKNLNVSSDGMNYPIDVTVDAQGSLFVCDNFNNRVLRFNNAGSKVNGAAADGVLGQSNFTSSTFATTQSGMYSPTGIALDAKGSLYVADANNNRVLIFSAAVGKQNGAGADAVLGQSDFTSAGNASISQNSLSTPNGVGVDTVNNKLWVADTYNNRILRFGLNASPGISSSKTFISFPEKAVGDSALLTVHVRSASSAILTITGVATSTSVFSAPLTLPVNVTGGDSIAISVKFKPPEFGSFADSLKINSNGGNLIIVLNGSSPLPQLTVDVDRIDFGSVEPDSLRSSSVTIRNASVNTLRIDIIKTNSQDFALDIPPLPAFVSSGDSLAIGIFFIPHAAGDYSDTLSLTSNSSSPLTKILLTGNSALAMGVGSWRGPASGKYELSQNYPNPFNPSTRIRFSVPDALPPSTEKSQGNDSRFVSLRIFNVLGREVATLVNEEKRPGSYTVQWNASGFPSGMYFFKLSVGDFAETKRMLMMK